jgi:high affinity Mn2+ porin
MLLAASPQAMAADLPIKVPVRSVVYDWTGFYLGGHVGYASGGPAHIFSARLHREF